MSNRIRQVREQRGLSQDELAAAAGTSFQQISRLENGQRRLTQDWMRRIGEALGVSPGSLIDDPAATSAPFDEAQNTAKTPSEIELLSLYRAMTSAERRLMLHLLRRGFGGEEISEKDHIRPARRRRPAGG